MSKKSNTVCPSDWMLLVRAACKTKEKFLQGIERLTRERPDIILAYFKDTNNNHGTMEFLDDVKGIAWRIVEHDTWSDDAAALREFLVADIDNHG